MANAPAGPPVFNLPGALANGAAILQNQTAKTGALRSRRLVTVLSNRMQVQQFSIRTVLDDTHSVANGGIAAHGVAVNAIEAYVQNRIQIGAAVANANLQGCARLTRLLSFPMRFFTSFGLWITIQSLMFPLDRRLSDF